MNKLLPVMVCVGGLVAGCNGGSQGETRNAAADATPGATSAEIPDELRPFGDGFPAKGSPCRRLGESPATSNYLDHTRILVGCPGTRESAVVQTVVATGGHIVAEIDGIVMLSVPVPATGGQAN
jgi:hypothetical protein